MLSKKELGKVPGRSCGPQRESWRQGLGTLSAVRCKRDFHNIHFFLAASHAFDARARDIVFLHF